MLIKVDEERREATEIGGIGHVVISIDEHGKAWLQAFFRGRMDAVYGQMNDERLARVEVPKLLAELREKIQFTQQPTEQGA